MVIVELKLLDRALKPLTVGITFSPFTPKSDQCPNSPAASQEICHHTVWRTWLFIAYSDAKWLYYKFSLHHSYNRFLKGWENTIFELRSERVNPFTPKSDQCQISPCSLTRNITPHSMKNLTFHSLLRWKVIILQILATSLIQSLFERLGEYTFRAQEWKGEPFHSQEWSMQSHQKYNTTQYEELDFSKPTHMEDDYIKNSLTTSPIQFSLRLGECTFWTWEWKGFNVLQVLPPNPAAIKRKDRARLWATSPPTPPLELTLTQALPKP